MSFYGERYPPSRPRRVEGGLKARSTRGAIGESWWSRRFTDVLESWALGTRLTRGRSYARAGQVLALEVVPGVVTASVQGSRPRPYQVTIRFAPLPELCWAKIEIALAEQAIYSARLLAGEVPPDLEEVFTAAGAPLFPAGPGELDMRCSCPDFAVPCKHLAATFYLLAESFDTDPFQILHWRGRSRDALLGRLRELRTGGPEPTGASPDGMAGADAAAGSDRPADVGVGAGPVGAGSALAEVPDVPLADHVDVFWRTPQPLPPRPVSPETDVDLLLRQLPAPGAALGGTRLVERLRPAYERFADESWRPTGE